VAGLLVAIRPVSPWTNMQGQAQAIILDLPLVIAGK
jgi:hypothetical protein